MGDEGVELYYMRSRWYEPKTGRFLSEDPIGLAGGINPLAYASNNPVSLRDPTGLVGECGQLEPDAVECKEQGVVWGGSASLYYLSGDWGYVEWFHGVGQWMKQCNVPGSPAFCVQIRGTIDWLLQRDWSSEEQLVCRWMAGRADDRYKRGGYFWADERDAGRYYSGWGTPLDFEDVHAGRMYARDARVLIIGKPGDVILRGVIVHEEAHYLFKDRSMGGRVADVCQPYY